MKWKWTINGSQGYGILKTKDFGWKVSSGDGNEIMSEQFNVFNNCFNKNSILAQVRGWYGTCWDYHISGQEKRYLSYLSGLELLS